MVGRQFRFHDGEKGSALAVRVKQSRANSCFKQALKDGTVVIQIQVGGGALDDRLIDFISRELTIPKQRIQVIAGQDGENKLVSIVDMRPREVQRRILELIS